MEGQASATIKCHSLSQALRGRGNYSEQKQQNNVYSMDNRNISPSSKTEIINPQKLTFKYILKAKGNLTLFMYLPFVGVGE